MKKKDDKISKGVNAILKPYNKEIKRHMSALSEDFQGRVKVIGEQFTGLNTKIDKIQETVDSHTKTLVSHTEILKSHTEMIGKLAEDMTTVKDDVKSIKESLKTKVSRKKFGELERRVSLQPN